jgi:hypothetical protein
VVDTYEPSAVAATKRYAAGDGITVRPRSIVVLQGTSRIAG